jgi:DNA-binding Lrp family transcriptional regulator
MARKAFVVTEATREKVRYLAGVGVPQDDIAKIVGCAPKTLRKRLRDELDRGVAEANATVSGYLFAAAKAGNIAAIIFWLKSRANWRERRSPDEAISAIGTEANSNVVLVLPDNGRDPELTQVLQSAQEEYYTRKRKRQRARTAPNLSLKPEVTGSEEGPVRGLTTMWTFDDRTVGQTPSKHDG